MFTICGDFVRRFRDSMRFLACGTVVVMLQGAPHWSSCAQGIHGYVGTEFTGFEAQGPELCNFFFSLARRALSHVSQSQNITK